MLKLFLRQLVKKHWSLLMATSAAFLVSAPKGNTQTELPPEAVINLVYQGIQIVHGPESAPKLYFGGESMQSSCGLIEGSAYCSVDHLIFIPTKDIEMAYEHGDAALAYIVAHEYAHAMQTAFGFMPKSTPVSELQADCLAGLYLGVIPNVSFDTSDMLEIGSLAHRVGDYDWGSRHHHGTPQQRIKAVSIGMDASSAGPGGVRACLL